MTFRGKYFDGKSSTGYPAMITLQSFSMQISFTDSSLNTQTIEWEPEKIHPNDFAESGKVILKYGEYPFKYVEVSDANFGVALKDAYPEHKFHKTAFNFIFSSGFKGLAVLAALALGLLALSYFVILPELAEHIAIRVPMSVEKQIGDASFNQMIADEKIDEENSKCINQFFKELHYKTDYDLQMYVVKDNIVNAFALPGGKIVVYQGILRTMDNYKELTALLSHEFSHVQLKHSTRNIFRSLSSYMFISLLFGDASGVTAVVIQNADKLKQLGYSRQLEEDADRNGLRLMKERHVDPEGMEELFNVLKKEEGDFTVPQFLSTHPLTKERINYVKKDIAKHDYKVADDEKLDSLWKEIKNNLED